MYKNDLKNVGALATFMLGGVIQRSLQRPPYSDVFSHTFSGSSARVATIIEQQSSALICQRLSIERNSETFTLNFVPANERGDCETGRTMKELSNNLHLSVRSRLLWGYQANSISLWK